jgi:signal transduction histidine kinase
VAWSDARQRTFRLKELERDSRIVARQFASRLRSALEQHSIALQQMANFFENSQAVTEQEFYDFAARTFTLGPPCLRISHVDPSLTIRWVYPPGPNRAMVGFAAKEHPLGYETVTRARETGRPALSRPLQLIGGPQGFLVAVPILRQGRFLGEVIGSFRSAEFFAAVAIPEILQRYDQSVYDGGIPLYASQPFGPDRGPSASASETFVLGGTHWEARVSPRQEVIHESLRSGEAALWTLGILLALGAGCVVFAGTFWASEISVRLRSQGAALRETRERLDEAMQQLLQAEKMKALGELVAGVAHEINNPLSSIMGYTQLLLARDLQPEVRRRLEVTYEEAERIGRIVRNLLTFARKHPPERRTLGLNGIIEKTLELKAYHLRVSQIIVEKDLDPALPMTLLDYHQIQQVLINLLNNAEQALTEIGRGGTLRITTRAAGDRIEARFEDDGPGVPPAIQGRIFEPFFTTKTDGRGTGLGLSLCYGIVQEHGGTIRVESRPGHGATFIIDLPVIRETPAAVAPDPGHAAPAAPGLRILVIDDEQLVQGLLVELLTGLGHRVDTASGVPEGLTKIAADGHDLIISDMRMPKGSGRDVYRAVVEKHPRLSHRVIFTIGDGASPETRQFLQETGNPILWKPFTIEDIRRAIAAAVGN